MAGGEAFSEWLVVPLSYGNINPESGGSSCLCPSTVHVRFPQDLEGTVDNKLYNLARDYYEEYKKVV